MRIGIIQQANNADRADNVSRLQLKIRSLAGRGADLIVLQELHNGLYFCQTEATAVFDQAETIPGPSTDLFGQLAKELHIVIVLSLFEKRAAGIYHNTAVVIENDGTITGKYRKMHIPDDPAYYEKFYFTPGDMGFRPIDTSVGRLGLLVCWDQWYPEAARLMALAGAELLIYPTAIGWGASRPGEEERRRDGDGWFGTGDLAVIDDAGQVRITGRAKDLIKSGGEWINPAEIEAIVGALPEVSFAAVIGCADPKWGERPHLLIELSLGKSISDELILAALKGRIASWWMPDSIKRLATMPLAATGKIDKSRLRAEYGRE